VGAGEDRRLHPVKGFTASRCSKPFSRLPPTAPTEDITGVTGEPLPIPLPPSTAPGGPPGRPAENSGPSPPSVRARAQLREHARARGGTTQPRAPNGSRRPPSPRESPTQPAANGRCVPLFSSSDRHALPPRPVTACPQRAGGEGLGRVLT